MRVIPTGRSTVLLAAALATVLIVAAGAPMGVAAQEDGPDPVPAEYYGEVVDTDGEPVGSGVLVEAVVDGQVEDSLETDAGGRFGSPEFGGEKLTVDASGAEDQTVYFRVDGEEVSTTAEWEAADERELTLSANVSDDGGRTAPAEYSGTVVTTGGEPVDNTTVEALVDGEAVDSVGTNENGAFGDGAEGVDLLVVSAGDTTDQTVQFRVDGEQTNTTVEWGPGETASVTLEVEADESDGEGGGGGQQSGGGGQQSGGNEASLSIVDVGDGATVTVREAPSTAPVTADISGSASGSGLSMEELELEMTFSSSDFRLEVGTPTDEPTTAPVVDNADTVGYFTVDAINVDSDRIDSARIGIEVEESELPDGASHDDLVIYRYHDGSWGSLETSASGDGEITGETPGFSAFTVGVPNEPEKTETGTPTGADPSEAGTTTEPGSSGETTESENSTETDSPGFGAVTALLALGGVGVARARRRI